MGVGTPFVHLHVHTHYSLLDGATRIEGLVQKAKSFGMPAVAISDHGNLHGALEFYGAALKAGVKPIIGCELYLANGNRFSRNPSEGKDSFHLLVLAMNRTGYANLVRLSSIGYTEGFYRRPRIDKEVLREFSEGLICTSTCIGGEIPQAFLKSDRRAAEEVARTYLEIFGPDRFFVELQDHGLSEQRMINPELRDLAKRLGVAVIATNDVHYLDHEDHEAHDVLCCINTGAQVSDEDRFKFPSDQFFFKSGEEMSSLFSTCPDAVAQTVRVADLCALELDLSRRHAPTYRVPDDVRDDKGRTLSDGEFLRRRVYDGLTDRYPEVTEELRRRIDYELEVIIQKGFASYFLIVWDCVRFARERGIPVSARGSGCSSVVSYCLRISAPDPIRYGLHFERFLDPDRDEMPDIDLDVCQNGRGALIDYIRDKYGHVAQIITFGTLKARAVIKDVARVLGLGFDQANRLTRLIPAELGITLDRALNQEVELKKQYEADPTIRRIVDIGRRLEGIARNAGVHAAGVVVADEPLINLLPVCKASGQQAVVTQFDGPTVEKVGLLKMDFLGLRTLTTLERARQLAERGSGRSIELEHIDLTDPNVYALFARGDTKGIFQFESGGMRDVVMRMKPNRIEDLIAANALFRPGPMEYIPDYIARKHGAPWSTPHPIMTDVLSETYGIMVYQEQVSRLVNRLAGIELKAAFRLAKVISKKKTDQIEAMRENFLSGCRERGLRREVALAVFDDILRFGGYAFNKAHSTGYALIAYQTAWMKVYHPLEFMAALMTFEMSSIDKVAEYREACRSMGIEIDPPCVNSSELDFVVERRMPPGPPGPGRGLSTEMTESRAPREGGPRSPSLKAAPDFAGEIPRGSVRFGLGAIKGVGANAVEAIVAARRSAGPFRDLMDFCARVDLQAVNRGTLEALICAGTFDRTGVMRGTMMSILDRAIAFGQDRQRDRRSGQFGLFGDAGGVEPIMPQACQEEWTEGEMLAREKAVLGFYITKHPLARHEALLRACTNTTIADLVRFQGGEEVVVGGMVAGMRTVTARGGRQVGQAMGIVTLEDLTGRIEAIVFPKDLGPVRPLLVPDAVVLLRGTVDRKREEPAVRVQAVTPGDQAIAVFARSLLLHVAKDTDVERLVFLLREHRGECRVYLSVETQDQFFAQVECHAGFRVSCTPELLQSLEELVGTGRVRVIGPTRRPMPRDSSPVFGSRPSRVLAAV